MSAVTTRCSSHLSVYSYVCGAHTGETGLGKYWEASTVHQKFKDKVPLRASFNWTIKGSKKFSWKRRRTEGIRNGGNRGEEHSAQRQKQAIHVHLKSHLNKTEHTTYHPPSLPTLHLFSLLAFLFLLVAAAIILTVPSESPRNPHLTHRSYQPPISIILSPWFCSHVAPHLHPHCHRVISDPQNICTGKL